MPCEEQLGGITGTGESPKQGSGGNLSIRNWTIEVAGCDFFTPDNIPCDHVPCFSPQT